MSLLEKYDIYKEVLKEAQLYHPNPVCLSSFNSTSVNDKLAIRQQNIEIILLIKILEKLEKIESLESGKGPSSSRNQDINKIDDLILRLGKLDINSSTGTKTPKSNIKRFR